ncbi:MAG: hypothetical protein INQ03_08215 [Candidatus Heimdallarchaeota archaeon]|nr:hypothetical protein [Candidatus Heimdallarchaeota archaeon]
MKNIVPTVGVILLLAFVAPISIDAAVTSNILTFEGNSISPGDVKEYQVNILVNGKPADISSTALTYNVPLWEFDLKHGDVLSVSTLDLYTSVQYPFRLDATMMSVDAPNMDTAEFVSFKLNEVELTIPMENQEELKFLFPLTIYAEDGSTDNTASFLSKNGLVVDFMDGDFIMNDASKAFSVVGGPGGLYVNATFGPDGSLMEYVHQDDGYAEGPLEFRIKELDKASPKLASMRLMYNEHLDLNIVKQFRVLDFIDQGTEVSKAFLDTYPIVNDSQLEITFNEKALNVSFVFDEKGLSIEGTDETFSFIEMRVGDNPLHVQDSTEVTNVLFGDGLDDLSMNIMLWNQLPNLRGEVVVMGGTGNLETYSIDNVFDVYIKRIDKSTPQLRLDESNPLFEDEGLRGEMISALFMGDTTSSTQDNIIRFETRKETWKLRCFEYVFDTGEQITFDVKRYKEDPVNGADPIDRFILSEKKFDFIYHFGFQGLENQTFEWQVGKYWIDGKEVTTPLNDYYPIVSGSIISITTSPEFKYLGLQMGRTDPKDKSVWVSNQWTVNGIPQLEFNPLTYMQMRIDTKYLDKASPKVIMSFIFPPAFDEQILKLYPDTQNSFDILDYGNFTGFFFGSFSSISRVDGHVTVLKAHSSDPFDNIYRHSEPCGPCDMNMGTDALGVAEDITVNDGSTQLMLFRIRKRPDLLLQEWDQLIDEQMTLMKENPLASPVPMTFTIINPDFAPKISIDQFWEFMFFPDQVTPQALGWGEINPNEVVRTTIDGKEVDTLPHLGTLFQTVAARFHYADDGKTPWDWTGSDEIIKSLGGRGSTTFTVSGTIAVSYQTDFTSKYGVTPDQSTDLSTIQRIDWEYTLDGDFVRVKTLFTDGTLIEFINPQEILSMRSCDKLLAHELTHVVQSKGNTTKITFSLASDNFCPRISKDNFWNVFFFPEKATPEMFGYSGEKFSNLVSATVNGERVDSIKYMSEFTEVIQGLFDHVGEDGSTSAHFDWSGANQALRTWGDDGVVTTTVRADIRVRYSNQEALSLDNDLSTFKEIEWVFTLDGMFKAKSVRFTDGTEYHSVNPELSAQLGYIDGTELERTWEVQGEFMGKINPIVTLKVHPQRAQVKFGVDNLFYLLFFPEQVNREFLNLGHLDLNEVFELSINGEKLDANTHAGVAMQFYLNIGHVGEDGSTSAHFDWSGASQALPAWGNEEGTVVITIGDVIEITFESFSHLSLDQNLETVKKITWIYSLDGVLQGKYIEMLDSSLQIKLKQDLTTNTTDTTTTISEETNSDDSTLTETNTTGPESPSLDLPGPVNAISGIFILSIVALVIRVKRYK